MLKNKIDLPTVNIRWLVFFLRKIRNRTENILHIEE